MTVVIKGLQKWEVIGLKASYRENVTVLPAQHGRLIDADALMENAQYKGTHDIVTAWDIVAAPTIIEAEEGDG